MTAIPKLAVPGIVVLAVGVAATAAPTSAAPTTTTAPPTTTPATTTVPVTSTAPAATAVFPSLDAFVAAWNDSVADVNAIDPSVETFVIDPAAIVRQPMPSGETLAGQDAFAVPIGTNGFVGGLIDPATGQVSGVLVGGDPDAQVVRSSVGVLLLASLDPALAGPAADSWAALAADTGNVQVDIVTVGDLAVTLEVVAGAEEGDNLVSVFIGPPATTPESLAAPYLAFVAVFTMALSAPTPTTLAGATTTTAPIARLPVTVAPAATTTTLLPTIGLPLPGATTTVA